MNGHITSLELETLWKWINTPEKERIAIKIFSFLNRLCVKTVLTNKKLCN